MRNKCWAIASLDSRGGGNHRDLRFAPGFANAKPGGVWMTCHPALQSAAVAGRVLFYNVGGVAGSVGGGVVGGAGGGGVAAG